MKTIMKILGIVMVAVIITGCSDEELIRTESNNHFASCDTKVSISEALEHAATIMADFEPATRSESRKVSSISSVLSNANTRSGQSDTLLYVVNYEDNMGYAILGADQRANPVYAFSTEGNINLNDTVKDPMFSLFVNSAIEDANNRMNAPIIIGGWGDLTPSYIMEYRNKRIADAGIPDHIENLVLGNSDNVSTGTLNAHSDITLALLKILPTTHINGSSDLTWLFNKITGANDLQACWSSVLELKNELSFNNVVSGLSDHIYFIAEDNDESPTGCGCPSYWGLRCNVHTEQMFNLLSPHWNGYDRNKFGWGMPQGFIVHGRDDLNNASPAFVVDIFRTHDAYKYHKNSYLLISGPLPEQWMHCLWSKAGQSNGFYLYIKEEDTLENGNSPNITELNTLLMFGGFFEGKFLGL